MNSFDVDVLNIASEVNADFVTSVDDIWSNEDLISVDCADKSGNDLKVEDIEDARLNQELLNVSDTVIVGDGDIVILLESAQLYAEL